MKRWGIGLLAVVVLSSAGAEAAGRRRGGCPPPSAPACGVQYVTEYRTVSRTVCEYVADTKEQMVDEWVCEAKTTKEDRKYCWYETEVKPIKVKRTVWRCVLEPRTQKVCTLKLVRDKVKHKYTVATPKYSKVKRETTIMVPEIKTVERDVSYTVYDRVLVPRTVQVTCYTPTVTTVCVKPCGSSCGTLVNTCRMVPTVKNVTVNQIQCVPRAVTQKVKYNICQYVPKPHTYEETVCEYDYKTEEREVEVCRYEQVWEDRPVQVAVMKPSEEEVEVMQCHQVLKSRTDKVDVTRYEMVKRSVKRPVTTWKLQTRVITEKVPVTVCVPVTAAPAVCMPAPCGY